MFGLLRSVAPQNTESGHLALSILLIAFAVAFVITIGIALRGEQASGTSKPVRERGRTYVVVAIVLGGALCVIVLLNLF